MSFPGKRSVFPGEAEIVTGDGGCTRRSCDGGGRIGYATATSVTISAPGGSTTGSPMNVPLVALSLIALSSAVTAD